MWTAMASMMCSSAPTMKTLLEVPQERQADLVLAAQTESVLEQEPTIHPLVCLAEQEVVLLDSVIYFFVPQERQAEVNYHLKELVSDLLEKEQRQEVLADLVDLVPSKV